MVHHGTWYLLMICCRCRRIALSVWKRATHTHLASHLIPVRSKFLAVPTWTCSYNGNATDGMGESVVVRCSQLYSSKQVLRCCPSFHPRWEAEPLKALGERDTPQWKVTICQRVWWLSTADAGDSGLFFACQRSWKRWCGAAGCIYFLLKWIEDEMWSSSHWLLQGLHDTILMAWLKKDPFQLVSKECR